MDDGKTEQTEIKSEDPQSILNYTQGLFRSAFRHPVIPYLVHLKVGKVLEEIELLSDEQIKKLLIETSPVPLSESTEELFNTQVKGFTALCLPETTGNSKPRIIVKKSYLEKIPEASDFFPDLIAEELAHAFSTERRLPFNQVKDQSFVVYSFKSKAELIEAIQKDRLEFFPDQITLLTENNLSVVIRGFASHIQESDAIRFPLNYMQLMLEETRAAIIQTLFQSVIEGQENYPEVKPTEQFKKGAVIIMNKAEANSALYLREGGAFHFLTPYLFSNGSNDKQLKEVTEKLLTDLYYKTPDEFINGLPPNQLEGFRLAMRYVVRQFELRGHMAQADLL